MGSRSLLLLFCRRGAPDPGFRRSPADLGKDQRGSLRCCRKTKIRRVFCRNRATVQEPDQKMKDPTRPCILSILLYQSSAKSLGIDAGDGQRDDVNTRCLQDISKKLNLQKFNIENRVELS